MLCDDCKEKQASVHITKINNNQKTEKHLCDTCAEKAGELSFSTDANFAFQDFLKGMMGASLAGPPQHRSETACPNCGLTYGDFGRSGKIGCGECYTAYGDRLEPLLRRIHGTSAHTGKVPRRGGGKLALRQRLRQLRSELDRHVGREEYEQAAKVRDEIKALEGQINAEKG
ncbi:MAG: UvrB/UvrC motif-containing protein [Sporomusaceae bacterium]|nr:UvrB/UvrC motif-containing protein [Sporomusaceae bacterium]